MIGDDSSNSVNKLTKTLMDKADEPVTIVVGRHLTVGLTPNVELVCQKFVISTTRFTQNKSISNASITLYV